MRPKGSLPDELLQVLHHRMEVVGEPHAEDPAAGLGCLNHALGPEARLSLMGFSQSTWHPAWSDRMAMSACSRWGGGDHHHLRRVGQQALEGIMGRNLAHFPQGPLQVVGVGFAQLHRQLRPGRQHPGVPASDGPAADHCNAPLGHSPPAFQVRFPRR